MSLLLSLKSATDSPGASHGPCTDCIARSADHHPPSVESKVWTKSKRRCRSLTEEEAAAASLAGVLLNLSDGLGAEDARGVFALEHVAKGLQ